MKPARLSRQTTLTTNQNCRPPSLSLYAKSAAGLRQAGGRRQAREWPTYCLNRKLEASAVMNTRRPRPASRAEADPLASRRDLAPAARRALAEAAARRAEPAPAPPRERNRRGRAHPARHCGWGG